MLTRPNFMGVSPIIAATIYGEIKTTAVAGQMVAYKDNAGGIGNDDPLRELELATAKRAYFLTRDAVDPDVNLALKAAVLGVNPLANFKSPVQQPGEISAVRYRWVVVEGAVYLHDSVDENTAVDTPLTTKAGKFATLAAAEEIVAYLRVQLTPLNGGDARLKIEMVL